MKTLKITFPYHPENISTRAVQALFDGAAISVKVGAVATETNIATIEVDRELTPTEIATARTAFQAAYPRIENVP